MSGDVDLSNKHKTKKRKGKRGEKYRTDRERKRKTEKRKITVRKVGGASRTLMLLTLCEKGENDVVGGAFC